tara:strand:+ start:344 stop:571 length:228 start_codon:yes stop_codon:yes gene_type:complete
MKSPIKDKIYNICFEKKINPQLVINEIIEKRIRINSKNSHVLVEIINQYYTLDIYDYRDYKKTFAALLLIYPLKL